jgi:hypothetical protein
MEWYNQVDNNDEHCAEPNVNYNKSDNEIVHNSNNNNVRGAEIFLNIKK